MRAKVIRVAVQVVVVFGLLIGFMVIVTAATGRRRSPWATALIIAIVAIVRGIYMWRTTPPNSRAKLVK